MEEMLNWVLPRAFGALLLICIIMMFLGTVYGKKNTTQEGDK